MLPRRTFLAVLVALLGVSTITASGEPATTQRGRDFLAGLLDTDLGLLPEFRGAKTYWLWHDNYLAARVLADSHPAIAQAIMAAIRREGVAESDGKTELFFGKAGKVLPFRHYELKDVRQAADKLIRTEVATDREMTGWESYADLLLIASIAEAGQPAARQHWEAAMQMWDGKGFADAAFKEHRIYATYKLALALLAARRLAPPAEPPAALLRQLLALQADSGGWITDYDADGRSIGTANVETSCLAILGIEAAAPAK